MVQVSSVLDQMEVELASRGDSLGAITQGLRAASMTMARNAVMASPNRVSLPNEGITVDAYPTLKCENVTPENKNFIRRHVIDLGSASADPRGSDACMLWLIRDTFNSRLVPLARLTVMVDGRIVTYPSIRHKEQAESRLRNLNIPKLQAIINNVSKHSDGPSTHFIPPFESPFAINGKKSIGYASSYNSNGVVYSVSLAEANADDVLKLAAKLAGPINDLAIISNEGEIIANTAVNSQAHQEFWRAIVGPDGIGGIDANGINIPTKRWVYVGGRLVNDVRVPNAGWFLAVSIETRALARWVVVNNLPFGIAISLILIGTLLGYFAVITWLIAPAEKVELDLYRTLDDLQIAEQSVADGLCIIDEEGRIIRSNDRLAVLLDISSDALRPGTIFWPAVMEIPVLRGLISIRTKPGAHTFDVLAPGGSRFLQVRYYHAGPISRGKSVLALTDITAKKMEQQTEMAGRLEENAKMQALGRLAGGVAHDFNNHLGSINGYASFIADDTAGDTRDHRRYAKQILVATNRARELIQSMLTFARTTPVVPEPFALEEVITEAVQLLQVGIGSNVTLEYYPAKVPMVAHGVASYVASSVMNLVNNGADALGGREGRVTVSTFVLDYPKAIARWNAWKGKAIASLGELRPEVGSYAVLTVKDQGSGIPPEVAERMFDPFYTTKDVGKGTGLGLPMVHSMVMSLNGALQVQTEVGAGSMFIVYIPLESTTSLLSERRATYTSDELKGDFKVLIVEDDEGMANMMQTAFERLGYEPAVANGSHDALDLLEEYEGHWDAVLTDFRMPDINGIDLIRRIREGAGAQLPIILYSGFGEGLNEESALGAGASAFFVKPVDPSIIAATIRRLVLERRAAAAVVQAG